MGLYWRYEKMVRRAESRLDSTVGATGALTGYGGGLERKRALLDLERAAG